MTVPPALRKNVPSPVIFCRAQPREPQQQVLEQQSQLMPMSISPMFAIYLCTALDQRSSTDLARGSRWCQHSPTAYTDEVR